MKRKQRYKRTKQQRCRPTTNHKQPSNKEQLNEHKSFQTLQAKAPSQIRNRHSKMDAKLVESIEKDDPQRTHYDLPQNERNYKTR